MNTSLTRLSQLIYRPIVTEKTTRLMQDCNTFVFYVRVNATKKQITQAVEQFFNVKVVSVQTTISKGKVKSFRNRKGQRSDMKKAYVSLAEGHSIEYGSA